jgi:hypothetical protein
MKARAYLFFLALLVSGVVGVTRGPVAGNTALLVSALICFMAEAISAAVALHSRREARPSRWNIAGGIIVWLILAVFALATRYPAQHVQEDLYVEICISRTKKLCSGLRMYASDHDSLFPPAGGWGDLVSAYVDGERAFQCPEAPYLSSAYAYNAALASQSANSYSDSDNIVLIFESDGGWNAAGGPELLPDRPRHYRYTGSGSVDIYGFVSGEARRFARRQIDVDEEGEPTWAKAPEADWVIWEPVLREGEGEREPPEADKAH